MSSSIKKAVILAAGKGSRMLPLTKSIPKPMLPLYNKPALSYIVDECYQSGIEEIRLVVGHCKDVITHYFSDDPRITWVEQIELSGTANALSCVKDWIGNEPFALLYADEVMSPYLPPLYDLINIYDHKKTCVFSLEQSNPEFLRMYNCVSVKPTDEQDVFIMTDITEKPKSDFSSLFSAIGRMVLTPDIFPFIQKIEQVRSNNNELVLTEALALYVREHTSHAHRYAGKRYDIGYMQGWMDAHIDMYNKAKKS